MPVGMPAGGTVLGFLQKLWNRMKEGVGRTQTPHTWRGSPAEMALVRLKNLYTEGKESHLRPRAHGQEASYDS